MSQPEGDQHTVRFASQQQEIEPQTFSAQNESPIAPEPRDDLTPEAQAELRNLAMSLQKSRLQTTRMTNFNFEPVSRPMSRVSEASHSIFPCIPDVYRYLQTRANIHNRRRHPLPDIPLQCQPYILHHSLLQLLDQRNTTGQVHRARASSWIPR
jgi:hypothetical protein